MGAFSIRWLPPGVRFTRAGAFYCLGTLAVGGAAIHSGNNLLFLLLGGMLGTIAASGIISSLMLRGLDIERRVVGPAPVQLPVLIEYRIRNRKRRIPSYAITLRERGLRETAYAPVIPPGAEVDIECAVEFEKRGTYELDVLRISTGFPFGLFLKVKRLRRPGELIVWPRNDRPTERLLGGGGAGRPAATTALAAPVGARGEFRSLREYRPGDDRRDIHWRSSARAGEPVVREYSGDVSSDLLLALDARGTEGEASEAALEGIASLATAATARGRRFAASIGGRWIDARSGPIHLATVLTALARLDFGRSSPPPVAPPGAVLFSESAPAGAVVGSTSGEVP